MVFHLIPTSTAVAMACNPDTLASLPIACRRRVIRHTQRIKNFFTRRTFSVHLKRVKIRSDITRCKLTSSSSRPAAVFTKLSSSRETNVKTLEKSPGAEFSAGRRDDERGMRQVRVSRSCQPARLDKTRTSLATTNSNVTLA